MNNVCWLAEATEKSRAYCIYTDLYALVVMPWVCLLRILGLPMSDSVWNCGRSLVLWVPGISGSIGNGILGEYFPEREYNLLNPKRTRKRPKFQPCSRVYHLGNCPQFRWARGERELLTAARCWPQRGYSRRRGDPGRQCRPRRPPAGPASTADHCGRPPAAASDLRQYQGRVSWVTHGEMGRG